MRNNGDDKKLAQNFLHLDSTRCHDQYVFCPSSMKSSFRRSFILFFSRLVLSSRCFLLFFILFNNFSLKRKKIWCNRLASHLFIRQREVPSSLEIPVSFMPLGFFLVNEEGLCMKLFSCLSCLMS